MSLTTAPNSTATVLVVGGAGYIGSHVCKLLAENGHRVVVLDDLTTGHRAAVLWGELIQGSMADRPLVRRILETYSIGVVMHFAASSLVGESIADPYRYYSNNVCGSLSLLEAMREVGVTQFVFSSTAAVYGQVDVDQVDENQPCRPISPYGKTKLAVEMMLADAAQAYGLNAISLRYLNAAGADPSGLIGESHHPETHLIPRLLRAAAGEPIAIQIFGTDYPTRDGTCVRDYIHVTDLACAHLKAMDFSLRERGFHVFNLGNGAGFTVSEVIAAAESVTNRTLSVTRGPRRAGDPPALVASGASARKILGWEPERPSIEQIVADAWRWHQSPRY